MHVHELECAQLRHVLPRKALINIAIVASITSLIGDGRFVGSAANALSNMEVKPQTCRSVGPVSLCTLNFMCGFLMHTLSLVNYYKCVG